ncbi:MAG TPA: peptidase T, partial [Agriterribacter sp.]|nr:peptidase T [Agriterribacter sp.]
MAIDQITNNTAMFNDYTFTVTERFMRYVQTGTQSDPRSDSFPSTEKQKDLSRLLVKELQEMGIMDAELDEHGYVYATLASTTGKKTPVFCFCSHVDTSPDCSGEGVKPLLHSNYNGKDIVLPDEAGQVIRVADHPYLLQKKGEDIITASGTTLLGADDKSGVAVIMDMLHFFTTHP